MKTMNQMRIGLLVTAIAWAAWPGAASAAKDCGVPGTITVKTPDGKSLTKAATREFADGSVAVRARLAVNPDGALASYTKGDAGFTYIANGMDRWRNGTRTSCQKSLCRPDFLETEGKGFGPGTKAFCVYAIEVVPYVEGGKITRCSTDGSRAVIGNGLGKPKLGPEVESLSGSAVQTYESTTSIRHTVNGQARYLDSAALAVAVTPIARLKGKVVWVGGQGLQPTLALIGDTGPAFGEGSIALHQLLRWGKVSPQKPGPIPIDRRCGPEELALKEPFGSFPDAKGDNCRAGFKAKSRSDVRAYLGINQLVDFVVLGNASLLQPGTSRVPTEVTAAAIQQAAASYPVEKIQSMLACLPK